MKILLPVTRYCRMPVLYILFTIFIFMLVNMPAKANTMERPAYQYKDSIVISKLLTSKKYKIKIYTSANREVLFFNASGEEGKVFQFFLFNQEGTMVKQSQVRNKQTTLITNFSKGCYTFEVFSDDEHIENGTLTIK
jgi:hypothetical protein